MFYTAYQKYKSIIDKVVPDEYYVARKKARDEMGEILKE